MKPFDFFFLPKWLWLKVPQNYCTVMLREGMLVWFLVLVERLPSFSHSVLLAMDVSYIALIVCRDVPSIYTHFI